jgi:hypothetical protein
MSEKVTSLLESIVSKKPTEAREIFEQIMVEKLRETVAAHRDIVAESFFEKDADLEEDYESEDLGEEELTEARRKAKADPDAVRELVLHANNDQHAYNMADPVRKNLERHANRHIKSNGERSYSRDRAVDAWNHHTNRVADHYASIHGGLGEKGHHMFSPADRRRAAEELEDDFHFDHIGPLLANSRK